MQPHGRIRRHRAPVKKMFIAMAVLPFICRSAAAAPAAPPPPSQQSTVTLSNGVVMPRILLGMGLWCNTERCPAPAKPCADCYNDGEAAADIALALANGFHGIDTALGYGNQRGVGAAVRSRPAGTVFVQTKIPGCGSRNASECAAQEHCDRDSGAGTGRSDRFCLDSRSSGAARCRVQGACKLCCCCGTVASTRAHVRGKESTQHWRQQLLCHLSRVPNPGRCHDRSSRESDSISCWYAWGRPHRPDQL
jgi:hypothetical protein